MPEILRFQCEFCQFTDCSKSKISSHRSSRHLCNVSYNCTICEFQCGLKEIFLLHLPSHDHSHEVGDDTDNSEDVHSDDFQKKKTSWPSIDLLPLELPKDDMYKQMLDEGKEKLMTESSKRDRARLKLVEEFSSNNKEAKATSCNQLENQLKKTCLFKCPSCGSCFKSMQLLRHHRRKVHPTVRVFSCPKKFDSSFVAESKSTPTLSNCSKTQDSFYECAECNMKFTSFSPLESHLRSHVTSEISKREGMDTTSRCQTIANAKVNTPKYDEIKENVCNQNQRNSHETERIKVSARKGHKRGHINENIDNDADQNNKKRYMGKIQKFLSKKESLEKDKELNEMHYTQSEKMFLEAAKRIDRKAAEFQCPHCPYVGKVFRNFKEHVMSHSEQRPFVCSICCSSFVCKSKLVRHQRQVHNEARPFLCSECPYTGKSRSCLETHRLVMHPREENLSFLCPHCPAKFARASMLKTHALRHNTGPHKLFSCLSCSFSTNYRRQFDLHATLHTGKSCLCSLCGKAYSGQAQLKVHMRVQHSDQKFRCSLCDFVTKRPDGLTKHMKSHSTERPYLCPHCDYKGKRNAHLQRHLLRHRNKDQALVKNEKPEVAAAERFPCLSCDKVFKTRDKLMHHLKTHNIPDTHISDNIQSNLNSTSFSTSDIHTSTSISPGTSNSFYYNPNMANETTNNNSKSWATVPVQHFTPSRLSSVTASTTTIYPHNPLKQTNTDSSLHSTPSFFTSRVHLEVPHSDTFITQPTSHATANAPPLISPYKLSSSNMPLTNEQLGMAVSAIESQHSHQFPVITAPSGKSVLGIQNLDMSMAAPEVAPSLSNHLYGLMAPVVASPISNDHETSSAHTSTSELGRQQHYCSGTSFSSQHAGLIASQKPFCVDTHYQSVSASTVTPSTVHQHPHQTPSENTTLPMDYLPHNNVVTSEDKMQHQDGLSSVAPPSLSNHYPGLPPSMPPDVPMPSPANPAHHLQKAITTYQYESRDASST